MTSHLTLISQRLKDFLSEILQYLNIQYLNFVDLTILETIVDSNKNRYILICGWLSLKREIKNTASGDYNAEAWRSSKRHGDGFAGLEGIRRLRR